MYEGNELDSRRDVPPEMRAGSVNKIAKDKSVLERKHDDLTTAFERLGMYLNDLESNMSPVMGPALDFGPDGDGAVPEQSVLADRYDIYNHQVRLATDRIEHVLRRLEL